MRRYIVVFFLLAISAQSLSAQRRRPSAVRYGEPGYWFSAGAGLFSGPGVNDGRTQSTWDFGNSMNMQYRASLEKTVGSGSTFGVAGTYARVPFTYTSAGDPSTLPNGVTGAQCTQCDAHLDMMTLVGVFRAGAGVGFHQVIELSGGAVFYKNMKEDNGGATLAPASGNVDPIFSIGYGLGYGFSNRTQLNFVPEYAIAIHERSGLPNGVSNTNSTRSYRLSLRVGL
jgi:hypothetical protein